jgi:5'-3' exonuclease
VTWDRLRDKTYDAAAVEEKLGVCPGAVPDYLALVGDTADAIPGVPRWGARSAAVALGRYGDLQSIPRTEAEWDLPLRGLAGLLAQLRAHEAEVLLYRRLATLRLDVPLGVTLEELYYRGPRESDLADLRKELGLREGS